MDSFNAILSRFLGSALTHVQLSYFVTFKTCPPMRQPPVRRMDDVCVCVFAFEMGRVLGPLMYRSIVGDYTFLGNLIKFDQRSVGNYWEKTREEK